MRVQITVEMTVKEPRHAKDFVEAITVVAEQVGKDITIIMMSGVDDA